MPDETIDATVAVTVLLTSRLVLSSPPSEMLPTASKSRWNFRTAAKISAMPTPHTTVQAILCIRLCALNISTAPRIHVTAPRMNSASARPGSRLRSSTEETSSTR